MAGYDLEPAPASVTGRGYPMPTTAPEWGRHKREIVLPIRLTKWEREQFRLGAGVRGKFVLMANGDGTFDLVRSEAL